MEVSYTYSSKRPSSKKAPKTKLVRSRKKSFGPKQIVPAFALAILGAGIAFVGVIGWFSKDLPNPNRLIDRVIPLSTKIYDRTGTHLLYEVHGDKQRSLVDIKDIPAYLKNATIAAEDKDFYTHQGFDLKGILRAIVIDIIRGGKVQGGSTITQQFIKNSLLTSKKSFTRKMKELILAYQLERRFTKDQILQLYFNEIPYGSTAYGAESASQLYFGKSVKDLSLAESATLAALPKAPTYYSPWGNNRDKLIARQKKILNDMVNLEMISDVEAEDAKKEKLKFQKQGRAISAPHFVIYVKELLTETYGEKVVEEGGLKIITTLDYDKQAAAEKAVEEGAKKNLAVKAQNAALVSLDAKTGEILAMVGSKDYFDESIDGNVNVTLRKRQPGSSFKPIVYATAFMKGYTPKTTLFDLLTNFNLNPSQKDYVPKNYTGKEYGPVSMKKALAGSLNIAAVKTLYLAGVPQVIALAQKLGYASLTDPDRYGLALVLGGAEVTLLEHTAAFSAFAQEGRVIKPQAVLRVEDARGAVLEEAKQVERDLAFDPQVARQINDILSDNNARAYVFGARNHLTLDRPAGVKTGTTNDFHDAWTIGYTPSIVSGVWVGNNDSAPMAKGADGSKLAAPIWNAYMRAALAGTPPESFQKPEDVLTDKAVLNGGLGEEQTIVFDRLTGLPATPETPADLREEKIQRRIHSILYYLDKDDPLGPRPQNPEADPQFINWERGVRAWAEKNHVLEEIQPNTAGGGSLELPSLTILAPQENETIIADTLTASVQASASKGVQKVDYYLDESLIETVLSAPYALSRQLTNADNGFHTLTAKLTDAAGNTQSASVTINILVRKLVLPPL